MHNRIASLMLIFLATTVWATTRRVPADFGTIQSAFDAVQDDDTVLVALGVYAESLQAPNHRFVFKGDVTPDTGDYPRPIIDPSSLPHPDSIACLTLPSMCCPILEDLCFRNGARMYPHHVVSGGVLAQCPRVTVRRCVFDSTRFSLYAAVTCTLDVFASRFMNVSAGIYAWQLRSPVYATECYFHTETPPEFYCPANIVAHNGSGSRIVRCRFEGNTFDAFCELNGQDLLVQDCLFGPAFPPPTEQPSGPALLFDSYPSGVIENCIFDSLRNGQGFIVVVCACDNIRTMQIRNNRFANYYDDSGPGNPIVFGFPANGCPAPCGMMLEGNVFEKNHGYRNLCLAVELFGADATLINNSFDSLWAREVLPPLSWTVKVDGLPQWSRLSRNRFDRSHYGVNNHGSTDTLAAQENWWGDPTGPNCMENPGGLGETITGLIDYSPWCIDSACILSTPRSSFIPHPASFTLAAFPNPFNSTTVIRLEVPKPQIVSVELFDVLGRKVQELWAGAVADEKEIAVDGNNLPSGIYFVRATDTIGNRPLASTKIVLLK